MTQNTTNRPRLARLALGCAAVAASGLLLSGCLGPTYGSDKTQGEQLFSDLDGMLALGSAKDSQRISYAPRAELVKPADRTRLPPPRDRTSAANNADWPESPEERSARIQAAADARQSGNEVMPADFATEAKEGADPEAVAANTNGGRRRFRENDNGSTTLSPQELDSSREAFKARLQESQQGSPTARKYLSEPPVAYRAPASTAPVGDPGEDESTKEAKLKKKGGIGDTLRSILPF